MTPIPYLTFQGTCREAMQTYAEVFGGTLGPFMPVSQAPGFEIPPGKEDWVMHVGLEFAGGGAIYASDDIMGGTPPMQGASVLMEFPTAAEGAAAFARLSRGGSVRMDYGPTFWSPGFGTLTDRFGINWMISTTETLSAA